MTFYFFILCLSCLALYLDGNYEPFENPFRFDRHSAGATGLVDRAGHLYPTHQDRQVR